MKNILIIAVLCFLAFYGYQKFQEKQLLTDASTVSNVTSIDVDDIAPTYNDHSPVPQAMNTQSYTCDGRMHCSQMTSCAEATYFIQHCPNTKMDGDNDGIPCEQYLCQ